MTITALIRKLQKIEKAHGSRVPVCADTDTLRRTCNDVWQIVDLSDASVEDVRQVDGDGFQRHRKSGLEVERKCVVLR